MIFACIFKTGHHSARAAALACLQKMKSKFVAKKRLVPNTGLTIIGESFIYPIVVVQLLRKIFRPYLL